MKFTQIGRFLAASRFSPQKHVPTTLVGIPVVIYTLKSDHSSLSAVISMAQAVPNLCVSTKVFLKHQVNWNTVCGAIRELPWRNIWLSDNPVEVLNELLSWLVIIIIIIIKKGWQCKGGIERLTPYQSEDPNPTTPTHRKKEEKGKTAGDKK